MTGIFVIYTKLEHPELVQRRRNSYYELSLDNGFAYVQEHIGNSPLGWMADSELHFETALQADFIALKSDPAASFSYLWMKNRESITEAAIRGLELPLTNGSRSSLKVDTERRKL